MSSKLVLVTALAFLLPACGPGGDDYEVETTEANILSMLAEFRTQAQLMLSDNADQARQAVCSAVRPVLETDLAQKVNRFASRPAFFITGSVSAGAALGGVAGVDLVYDLWNHELSSFRFAGASVANRVGGEGTLGMGFAGGLEGGVRDWEGVFVSADAGLTTPLPLLSVGVAAGGFVSVPVGIEGVYAKLSVGVELVSIALPFLKTVAVSGQVANWSSWPDANRAIAGSLIGRLLGMRLEQDADFIRFKRGDSIVPGYYAASGTRMGASMALTTMPLLGAVAAVELGAVPVVLGVLRDEGYDDAFAVLFEICEDGAPLR